MFGDQYMLDSEFVTTIDYKGRMMLPVFTKTEPGEELVLIKFDQYVEVWSRSAIEKLIKHYRSKSIEASDPLEKAYFESYISNITAFSKVCRVAADGRRINLGSDIMKKYNLVDKVCVESKGDYICLWEPSKFLKYQDSQVRNGISRI